MSAESSIRWSRILAVLLVFFVILEAGTRLGVYLWAGRPFKSLETYIFLPDGGYWNNPNYTHPQFIHNSAGFRNTEEFSIEKPPNTIRILTIGHSALYSGISDTPFGWPVKPHSDRLINSYLKKVIENNPRFQGKKIEVINASLNLAGLQEMSSNFMNNLSAYHPDILIIFGSSNHFFRAGMGSGNLSRPFVAKSNRVFSDRFELAANDNSLHGLAERFFRTTIHYSAFFAVSYRVVDRVLLKINRSISAVAFKQEESQKAVSDKDLPIAERGYKREQLDEVYTEYVAFLDAIFAFCEDYEIKPVLFWEYYLINLHGVKPYSDYEEALSKYYLAQKSSSGWANTGQYFLIRDRIKEHLREKGVLVIDLYNDFRKCRETVFNDYLHYSENGNKWVAERIYERIKPLLDKL